MRPAETSLTCHLCGKKAEYADSVPTADRPGTHPSECGYKLVPLCWVHAVERRRVATSRVVELLRCELQGLARVDRDRAGGDCVCDECGKKYYDHPREAEFSFLNVLCDGSVVKL